MYLLPVLTCCHRWKIKKYKCSQLSLRVSTFLNSSLFHLRSSRRPLGATEEIWRKYFLDLVSDSIPLLLIQPVVFTRIWTRFWRCWCGGRLYCLNSHRLCLMTIFTIALMFIIIFMTRLHVIIRYLIRVGHYPDVGVFRKSHRFSRFRLNFTIIGVIILFIVDVDCLPRTPALSHIIKILKVIQKITHIFLTSLKFMLSRTMFLQYNIITKVDLFLKTSAERVKKTKVAFAFKVVNLKLTKSL